MTKPSIVAFDPAAKTEPWPDIPASEMTAGSGVQSGLTWFEDKSRGLSAGLWAAEPFDTPWADYPVNEFMHVLEGEITIVEKHGETTVKAGESFIIPKGLHCRWIQPGKVRKFFVIHDDGSGLPNAGPLHTIKIDPGVALDPSASPPPEMLLTPVPVQHTYEYFSDATGQLNIGVWDTTGYTRKLIDFPRHELMHLLEGSVTMIDDKGQEQTFKAGDTFFVPMGTPNSWKSEGYLRKIFVIFQPKG